MTFTLIDDDDDAENIHTRVISPSDHYVSDAIKVQIIPEKRGVFLKHTEYEVSSEKYVHSLPIYSTMTHHLHYLTSSVIFFRLSLKIISVQLIAATMTL